MQTAGGAVPVVRQSKRQGALCLQCDKADGRGRCACSVPKQTAGGDECLAARGGRVPGERAGRGELPAPVPRGTEPRQRRWRGEASVRPPARSRAARKGRPPGASASLSGPGGGGSARAGRAAARRWRSARRCFAAAGRELQEPPRASGAGRCRGHCAAAALGLAEAREPPSCSRLPRAAAAAAGGGGRAAAEAAPRRAQPCEQRALDIAGMTRLLSASVLVALPSTQTDGAASLSSKTAAMARRMASARSAGQDPSDGTGYSENIFPFESH
ncbi:serine/arginine repetitive matrix protein 3-like [Agelaius tricolor]|uniref:serine/arginine repetitive matrix protein 3-like n=1 Tax=Agelaius tricolor TaxID=9191 RepID=UPI0039F1FCA0